MEVWFRYSYENNFINIVPRFSINVTQGHGAELYYVDVYKLQWICSGMQPGIFYGSGGFGEKRAQYMQDT